MAIDKSTFEAYTNGYKFYVDDLKSKNITGKHSEEVEKLYNRILELGEQCSDINDFNANMQNEKISEKISSEYSQAITGNINMPKPGLNAGIGVASSIAGMAAMSGTRMSAANMGNTGSLGNVGSAIGTVSTAVSLFSRLASLFSFLKKKKKSKESDKPTKTMKTTRT